ncbi:hypothetical protein L916_03220, partial [Phytophthora nicotianae]
RDLPPFPGGRQKEVPPRLLLQSAIRDAGRLLAEDPGAAERRRARIEELRERRRQRVEGIRGGKFLPKPLQPNFGYLQALRAERVAVAKKEAAGVHLDTLGRTMRTRALDAKLQKKQQEDSALAEVMSQLEEEDNEGEPSDNACSCSSPASLEDESAQEAEAMEEESASSDAGEEQEQASDRDLSSESEEGSSEEESSGTPQKRYRTGHRKKTSQAARTATNTDRSEESEVEGAFLEGFSRRWDSWEAFYQEFEVFQSATFQQFTSRTSTSVTSRNRQMQNAIESEAKKTGKSRADVEKRKGTQYIPENWSKYCITLQCTHGRSQPPRGSGKRKHRKVRTTLCTAKINARVVAGFSSWYVAVKACGHHNHPVTKHQWFNYAENRKVKDNSLKQDAINMHKAGAHAKGILGYLREQSGQLVTLRDVHNMIQGFKKE